MRTDSSGTEVEIGAGGDITTDPAWAAKGDLIVATGNNAASVLTAGANDYVLTADDGQATGLKWAAATGGSGPEWLDNYWNENYPGSANATYDDEFDDTTGMSGTSNGLDARWNWRNQEHRDGDLHEGRMADTELPGGGIVKLAHHRDRRVCRGNLRGEGLDRTRLCVWRSDTGAGVVLVDGVNGDFLVAGLMTDSHTRYLGVQRWSNATTWGANTLRLACDSEKTLVYVRIVVASPNFTAWFSEDGIGYVKYYAGSAEGATRIGLGVNELTNNGLTKLHVDYFRKTA